MRAWHLALAFLFACGGSRESAPAPASAPDSPPLAASTRVLEAEPATLRVFVAGDVMPHRPRLADPARLGDALEGLGPLFARANAVVVNHEAAVVSDPARYTSLRAALVVSPAWTRELLRAHVGAVTLSNNHACDGGLDGLSHTMDVVDELGLVGVGADQRDPFRARVLAAAGGRRVCAVGWTSRVNAATSQCASSGKLALVPNGADGLKAIERAVQAARGAGCDAVIAIGHAGEEYQKQTLAGRAQASAAAEAGADAVVLHHPHVPSGIELVTTADGRRVPVYLSVGNLVSNQGETWTPRMRPTASDRARVARNAWTRLGLVADLSFRWEKTGRAAPMLTWGYHLTWTENEVARDAKRGAERTIATRPLDPARDGAIVSSLARDREGPTELFESTCWMARGPGCI